MKTRRLVVDAMLIALYFVLSNYFALNLGSIRLTLDVVPVILGAAMFGPVDGIIIGFTGNFLFQLAGPYGLSVTTVLWALPDALRGLMAGLLLHSPAQRRSGTAMLAVKLIFISLVITTVTTGVMYVDCLVFEYSFLTYTPFILWRYLAGILVSGMTAIFLPPLLNALDRTIPQTYSGGAHADNGN